MKKFYAMFFCLFVWVGYTQINYDVVEPNYIKTIALRSADGENYSNIFKLRERFLLSFDDLEADQKYYYYKIEHFDFNWQPSGLSTREYIKGYDNDRIRNEETSFNTLQFYTHYSVSFPNESTQLLLSGNYLLSIFDENENTVFTRRFVLYESMVNVGVSVHRSKNIATLDTHQNIQFSIHHPNFRVNNPNLEIRTVLMQNNNWETAINNLKPQFMRGNQLLYKYVDESSFWAGNEFWFFDTKAARFSNLYVASVESGPHLYHSILYTNIPRNFDTYSFEQDINGQFVIRNIDGGGEPWIDADYTWVFISLQATPEIKDQEIYVNGAYNNWRNDEENRMVYNPDTNLFEAKILMKQGFNNYQFVTLDDNQLINNHLVDGSFYQTENDYSVLVYYRQIGGRFDRVIGIGNANSRDILN
ncbi:DUF5103 domain-containing protein [Urechidicola sp. KH5]